MSQRENREKRNEHEQPIRELQYIAGLPVVVDVWTALCSAWLPCVTGADYLAPLGVG